MSIVDRQCPKLQYALVPMTVESWVVPEVKGRLHCCIWYSNTGGTAKEIDVFLEDTRWRILRKYRKDEFY